MVEVSTARFAGMMDILVAVMRHKALAFKVWTLAYYAPTATGYYYPHRSSLILVFVKM
jgi:hypothetical protein